MKGNVRIGVALMVGIVVILGALVVKDETILSQEGSVIVSQAPERTYIVSDDADGDGTKDWEESLEGLITDTVQVASGTPSADDAPYTPPTTFTGKFSEAFFQDYLSAKIAGADMSDPTELVTRAVATIDANTQSKRYSRRDFHIIQTTPESLRLYGNDLAKIITRRTNTNTHELVIFKQALDANDSNLLTQLVPIRDLYTQALADALQMNVPDSLALTHIEFLNATEAIRTNLDAMLIAFDDPLYALARFRGYEDDSKKLYSTFIDTLATFDAAGITFSNEEPGAVFYYIEK